MKRLSAAFILFVFMIFGSFAQAAGKTNMDKGDVAANVGMNLGWGYGVGGGAEYMFARWNIADTVPITFGGAVKAGADFWPGFELTVAGLVTAHFGLATFDVPDWAKKFDWYTALGVGVGIGDTFGIGLASGGGMAYHFSPKMAVMAESIYAKHFNRSSHGFSTIGVLFRL